MRRERFCSSSGAAAVLESKKLKHNCVEIDVRIILPFHYYYCDLFASVYKKTVICKHHYFIVCLYLYPCSLGL